MGGPFWAKKDDGAWSIFKGEHGDDEEPYAAARREFAEETGAEAPDGPALPLGEIRQRAGKRVTAWALEGDLDPADLRGNTFLLEWPPRSGRQIAVPEIDRAAWFSLAAARPKLVGGQTAFLDALAAALSGDA